MLRSGLHLIVGLQGKLHPASCGRYGLNPGAYLVVPVHPVLRSILVVEVEGALGSIDGQHVVVVANSIPLSILVGEDSALQDLVIAEGDTYNRDQDMRQIRTCLTSGHATYLQHCRTPASDTARHCLA